MGDLSYHYTLHKRDLSNAAKIEEIKHSIANLKLSVNSYVIVDLPPKKSSPYLVFFQTARERTFKQTNYYLYEIRIDVPSPQGIQKKMYRADHLRKREVLQAFEKICIQQAEPDLSKMEDITEKIFGGKKKDRQYDLAKNLISQYLLSPLPTQIQQYRYEEALNRLTLYNYYETNQQDLLRAEVYIQYGQYEKAKTIYESMTYHDSAAYMLATLICNGKLGKPDYKLAYEYFKHTTLLLDDLYQDKAKIEIARMYRDGKYLKQNYEKYLHIIKNLEKKFTRPGAKFDLCLPELYYELTLIEQKNGNSEAIENIDERIAALQEEIARIIAAQPYQYKFILADSSLVSEEQQQLTEEIASYQSYRQELQERYQELLNYFAEFTVTEVFS